MKTYQVVYFLIGMAIFLVCNYLLTTLALDQTDGSSIFDNVITLISSASVGLVMSLAVTYYYKKQEKTKA